MTADELEIRPVRDDEAGELLTLRRAAFVTEAQVMETLKRMAAVAESSPQWNLVMAGVVLAMLPPVVVVIIMQRLFVKGLVETEK